jgi:hypothetical protein
LEPIEDHLATAPYEVKDRADRPTASAPLVWEFNDLFIRAEDLQDFVDEDCTFRMFPLPLELAFILKFAPLSMVH